MAHVDLAKAEASEIGGRLAKAAALVGIAVAILLFAALLVVIGTSLFLAEWLFGSMGWGVLHGLLLSLAIATACILGAVGIPASRIGMAFVVAAVVGAIVAVVLGLDLTNRGYTLLGEMVLPGIEPGVRPLVVGLIVGGVLGLVLGVIGALRADSGGARLGSIVGLVVLGLLVGALTAIAVGPQVGIAIGIAVGYLVWTILMAVDVAGTGVDTDALKARFWPTQTIETSKETLEWLRKRMPPGLGS